MTVWIVDKTHIDLLVTAAIAYELIDGSAATDTGRELWQANLDSVRHLRAHEVNGQRPGPRGFRDEHVAAYQWDFVRGLIDPDVVSVAAQSMEGMCCEAPTWGESPMLPLLGSIGLTAGCLAEAWGAQFGPLRHDVLVRDLGGWDVSDRAILHRALEHRDSARRALKAAG